jgi:hypothetical protein
MYIRMLNFETAASSKAEVIAIMDETIPKIKATGCKDCMLIMHENDCHYALLVFWDSKQKADAAAPIIGPQLIPMLNRISMEAVTPRLYEVYEPKLVEA